MTLLKWSTKIEAIILSPLFWINIII
jgi:hypothetical protein